MDHQYYKDLQTDILNKVLEILKNNQDVLGVTNTGSMVKGENDSFSDIDIDCYLNNEEMNGAKEIIERVSHLFPLLSKLWIFGKNALFLFENGVRLDLNFYKTSEIKDQKFIDSKILFDPQGDLEKNLDKNPSPKEYSHPRWNPQEFEYVDWFFWMFRQVYAWTKRAEQKNYKSWNKMVSSVDSLSQIRNGIVEMKLWVYGSWNYMLKVDPAFAERMSKTFPHLDTGEILNSTQLLLQEFKEVCKPYCEKRKIGYPTNKFEVIKNIFDQFDKIS